MQITFVIAKQQVPAQHYWSRGPAQGQLIVLPDCAAFVLVQRQHDAAGIGQIKIILHQGHALVAGQLTAPQQVALLQVEAGHPALKGHGAHLFVVCYRRAGYIADAFQLGIAARLRYGCLP